MYSFTRVLINDVGLGLSIHVTTPDGKIVVFDLGAAPNSSPLKSLSYGKVIDYLFITHPHRDHIQDITNLQYTPGYLNISEAVDVNSLIKAARKEDKPMFEIYKLLLSSVDCDSSPHTQLSAGGAFIESFRATSCDFSNLNDVSSVTVLYFENTKMVICGDNEKSSLGELMRNRRFQQAVKNADILVAPHHGRESGFHASFVDTVCPSLTIISDTSKVTTSASKLYSSHSRGMKVNYRNSSKEDFRACLSTRKDGPIEVRLQPTITVIAG